MQSQPTESATAADQPEQQVTEQTLSHMTKVFEQAQQLLVNFNSESANLRTEIVGLFKNYNTSSTEMIPDKQIKNIMDEYQKGMKEAQKENEELEGVLEKEFEERDQLVEEMNRCIGRLDALEEKLKKKMDKKKQKEKQERQQKEPKSEEKSQATKEQEAPKPAQVPAAPHTQQPESEHPEP